MGRELSQNVLGRCPSLVLGGLTGMRQQEAEFQPRAGALQHVSPQHCTRSTPKEEWMRCCVCPSLKKGRHRVARCLPSHHVAKKRSKHFVRAWCCNIAVLCPQACLGTWVSSENKDKNLYLMELTFYLGQGGGWGKTINNKCYTSGHGGLGKSYQHAH